MARPMSAPAVQKMGASFARDFAATNAPQGILAGLFATLFKKLIEAFIASLLLTHDIVPKQEGP
jgi:hypothetical protein